jgi:predicted RNA-binding Zn ribbon-like protein
VKSSISKQRTGSRPPFLAGDLALDFLNTHMRAGENVIDLLQTDEDVLAWIERAGLPMPKVTLKRAPLSLLRDARVLRENIGLLVEKRKAGHLGDPSVLNRFLSHAQSHPHLLWKKPHFLTLKRVWQEDRPESILAPVAEAAAVLLTTADFRLVKRCEGERCVFWFFDKTKSRHRRWCSARICGNRHKVAAYRKRQRDQVSSKD